MEQTKLLNLPIIGRVQHGEKINNKVKEYGYFIVKSEDSFMQTYLDKFDKLFKGKQSIDIEFFNEEPLTKKYVRYNQSGEVCRCLEGSDKATQRVKNGWQQIQCDISKCQYRQRNESGKCACNRIGWLKFLIPSVSTDRIFLMKITGQTSINNLDDYIKLQKAQGHSIKGHYTIYLKQKEQSNNLGQTFNNYILDILKKDDFISTKQIPEKTETVKNSNSQSNTNLSSKPVSNEKTIQKTDSTPTPITPETKKDNTTSSKTEKKTSTSKKSKQTTTKQKETTSKNNDAEKSKSSEITEKKSEDLNYDNYFALLKTFKETLISKGKPKEYLIGEFTDMKDNISNIVIKPEYEAELLECDLGTTVKLDVAEIGGRKFAMNLEFLNKLIKNAA